jgi:hypothetical protein
LKGEIDNPVFNDKSDLRFEVDEFPNKIFFGSVRVKALILFLLNFSIKFNCIKVTDINGFNYMFLFDILNEKNTYYTESVVAFLDRNDKDIVFHKTVNISNLLKEFIPEYREYFLSNEMYELIKQGKQKDALNLRKKLITTEEKKFVEKLGLEYNPNDIFLN